MTVPAEFFTTMECSKCNFTQTFSVDSTSEADADEQLDQMISREQWTYDFYGDRCPECSDG